MNKQKLKVYLGDFDGIRKGLIAARNQEEAAGLAGCSLHTFRKYWEEVVYDGELKPWTLYTRILNYRRGGALWIEGICEERRRGDE